MIQFVLGHVQRMFSARRIPHVLALFVWLAAAQVASAQAPNNAPAPAKEYYLQYLLVAFCIALGLMAALRPTQRKDPEGGDAGWFGMMKTGGHAESGPTRPGERKKAPHRGVLLLVLGVMGLLGALTCCCWPFAIAAITMSKTDLAAMAAGRMDRSGEGMTKTAYYLAIVGLVLGIIGAIWNTYAALKQLQMI
jgi:hypothetical protein